jgi:hypothetical protein
MRIEGRARQRSPPRAAADPEVLPSGILRDACSRLTPDAQLGGLYERRAALVVVIFDLAVEALEALRGDDFAGLLDCPNRAGALA